MVTRFAGMHIKKFNPNKDEILDVKMHSVCLLEGGSC